jgi:hypothetical protein
LSGGILLSVNGNIVVAIVDNRATSRLFLSSLIDQVFSGLSCKAKIFEFESPDPLLMKFKEISPDIVITGYSFSNQPDMNGIDLVKVIRFLSKKAIIYLCTDMSWDFLEKQTAGLDISGILRPDIDIEKQRTALIGELKVYTQKYRNIGIDYKKMNEITRKLMHDLVKPVQNIFYMLKMDNDFSEIQKNFAELEQTYNGYSTMLEILAKQKTAGDVSLSETELEHLAPICEYFITQYQEYAAILNKIKTARDGKEIAGLKNRVADINRRNNEFTDNILGTL